MAVTEASLVPSLRRLIPGLSIYTAGNSHFQDCLKFYNYALNEQPLVCVRPVIDQEVSQVIQFCNTNAVPCCVRSGGHDFFGRSLIKGGVLIDMRAIDSIIIETGRASVRVGGGVIASTLQETLGSQGLFTPTGQAKSVGYVSWACGGGYGFYVGTYGFGVDQILGARVVLAGGHVVDTDQDPELLWALRGAGAGTFGIVTELRVKVYPVPDLYAGFLAFPLSEAATLMGRIDKLLDQDFPDEFSGDAIAGRPQMAPMPISEPCFVLFWCWTVTNEGLAPAKRFLDQMVQVGKVLGNTVTESKYCTMHPGCNRPNRFLKGRWLC
jgi:FAD/FMN-containing dehydrogenase